MRIGFRTGVWAAAMLVACHRRTAPREFAGRYHLTAFNGAAVPTPSATGVHLDSGWLQLDARGASMLSTTEHLDAR